MDYYECEICYYIHQLYLNNKYGYNVLLKRQWIDNFNHIYLLKCSHLACYQHNYSIIHSIAFTIVLNINTNVRIGSRTFTEKSTKKTTTIFKMLLDMGVLALSPPLEDISDQIIFLVNTSFEDLLERLCVVCTQVTTLPPITEKLEIDEVNFNEYKNI